MQYMLMEKKTFLFGGETHMDDFGQETFDWPQLPVIRQKPLDPDLANNYDIGWFFGHGAHMPIAVFVQSQARRRSLEKYLGRAEKNRKGKAERKGEKSQGKGNQKGYGDPRASKSGWKGSSAVAENPASSSSASHIGYGGYPGNEQDSQAFDGGTWDASHQAKPSGMGGDKPYQVWHDKAKNQ